MCRRLIVLLVVSIYICGASETKSCVSTCHENKFPPCGAWLHKDNAVQSSGIYLLGEGTVNLTCVVNSLPRPTAIHWLYRPDFEKEWKTVRCSSLRTTTDCRFNAVGEHQTTSVCVLRTQTLQQSGAYRCSAVDVDSKQDELATSGQTDVDVHGIHNVSVDSHELKYGRIGYVLVHVCANPKPNVIWFNDRDMTSVQAGQTVGRYSALRLEAVSERAETGRQGPAHTQQYCYAAKLFINSVAKADGRLTVTVSNEAANKHTPLSLYVRNAPKVASTTHPPVIFLIFTSLLSFRAFLM